MLVLVAAMAMPAAAWAQITPTSPSGGKGSGTPYRMGVAAKPFRTVGLANGTLTDAAGLNAAALRVAPEDDNEAARAADQSHYARAFSASAVAAEVVPAETGQTRDVYLNKLLYHCSDATMTAEVRSSEYHDIQEMDIVIPETVEADGKTYTVTSLGRQVFCYKVNSIRLPKTIRRIGEYAFYGSGITDISLPDSLEEIGANAFSDLKLESIVIPDGVKVIGNYAFFYNESLTSVTLPAHLERIGESAFSFCTNLTSIALPSTLKSIGESAFSNSGLTSVTLPEGVEEIGDWAFCGTKLTSFTFPAHVTTVPRWVLRGTNITEITVPAGVKEIGGGAFSECAKLTKVTLPDGVETIGGNAFYGCTQLTSIALPSTVTSIGEWAFGRSGLTAISLPEGLKYIGDNAFLRCNALELLELPQSVERIGERIASNENGTMVLKMYRNIDVIDGRQDFDALAGYAFVGEGNGVEVVDKMIVNNRKDGSRVLLEVDPTMVEDSVLIVPKGITALGVEAFSHLEADTIVLPEGLTSIGQKAFYYCTARAIVLPSTLKHLDTAAFSSAKRLEKVTLPESIEMVSEECFKYCDSLSLVVLPRTLKVIGKGAFYFCFSLNELALPEGLEEIGEQALGYTGITELTIPNSCTNFNVNGMIKVKTLTLPAGLKELPKRCFEGLSALRSITLPAGITAIPLRAFMGCSKLKAVNIPEGVKTIDGAAFAQTGLESVVIPESVESIEDHAFYNCRSLTSIDIKAKVKSLPYRFAAECTSLTSVSLPQGLEEVGEFCFIYCPLLTQVALPSSVKSLKYGAFAETGLESAVLPDGIERVGEFCFQAIPAKSIDLSNTSLTEMYRGLFVMCDSLQRVVLPASLKTLREDNFYGCTALTSVTCPAQEPPVAEVYSFDEAVQTAATLYVPAASLAAYKAADVWKNFFAVTGITETGMAPALTPDGNAIADIYDLSGRKTDKPTKGMNIIRMKNGTIRKVLTR